MDIISHTLSGVAVGTVMAAFTKRRGWNQLAVILMGGLGGALPDLDAISLWSKFDGTIGYWLGLPPGKEIYFGKYWYSHHAAMHSLFAAFLFPIIAMLLAKGFRYFKGLPLGVWLKKNFWRCTAFSLGYLIHLLEDMPTPHSVWGGVNLFFPSSGYVGGWGKIWWWNNYDLVLIIASVIIVNLAVLILSSRVKRDVRKVPLVCFGLGLILFLIQIFTRDFDFNYQNHQVDYAKYEEKSKELQREILGERLFHFMEEVDNSIPLNF